jgi:hypothetical protein
MLRSAAAAVTTVHDDDDNGGWWWPGSHSLGIHHEMRGHSIIMNKLLSAWNRISLKVLK